ncbi:hypothetical protein FKW77_008894 [Venturia effusa]|uniref:non-specific serine/threonine protein kinase n=1 Tax=Venturia effusa TaxID=50376 RepID=A0A517KX42_9PEZI|nr:hypothetical protein FKW77_008894 [Venturia effusa]
MSGDISLSQSLGGLRIANPDDNDSPSPPPPAIDSALSHPTSQHASSSSRSATSTVTATPDLSQSLPSPAAEAASYTASNGISPSPGLSRTPSQLHPPYANEQDPYNARLNHRQSMPLAQHAQQQMQVPQYSSSIGPNRGYAQSAARPMSGLYNHSNHSGGSQASSYAAYRYGEEPMQASMPTAAMLQRSGSRAAAAPGGMAREPGRGERILQQQQIYGGNGVAPPRRSSRRIPPLPSPHGIEGGPLPSSEEWKEKGAAVAMRQEVDANGKTVQKVTKKGVKDFSFGRTLGEGSYSTVMAATDRSTLREYAIKILDKRHIIKEKKVKYVNIEKDTLNRLTDHPGIVRLYYTFQDERSLYFVLDLAGHGELLGVLKKMGTFDEECTQFYGAQILDSIDYMHSRGVIHRDLKPENVLLDSHMHVKITDFGTAKILDPPKQNGSSTSGTPLDGADVNRAMSFVGTAEYVSPELLTEKNACKASDLWAFGCIVYQLLAGRPPFKAGNEYQTFQKIVGLDYAFPDGFPIVARDLVERLLVLDPQKRLPMEHIKNHEFFKGVIWGKGLWKQKAPRLKSYTPPTQEPIRLNGPSISIPASSSQSRPNPRVITELPPPSQLDIDWSPVLTRNNERILKLGNLNVTVTSQPHSPNGKGEAASDTPKKFSRFFGGNTSKRRQRLVMITSSARIVLAAAGGDEKKAKLEIPLVGPGVSFKSFKDGKGITAWCVDTPSKHLLFEDPKAVTSDPDGSMYAAREWIDTIERAKDFAIGQSLTNSYPGDSSFNDLGSTLSSPTSTIGNNEALEGVNIPATGRLRKGDDGESIKGRKRFSKRHSKNGLAAVF